jgi:hypothetical protein
MALEPQTIGIRHATGRQQQAVGTHLATGDGQDEFAAVVAHMVGHGVQAHVDAFGGKNRRQHLAQGRIFRRQQGAARQHGDTAAQPGEGLREFDGNHRTTDHRKPRRDLRTGQRFGGGPVWRAVQTG